MSPLNASPARVWSPPSALAARRGRWRTPASAATYDADHRHRVDLVAERARPVAQERGVELRHDGQLLGRRLVGRAPRLHRGHRRLRGQRDPVPVGTRRRLGARGAAARLRVHADRRGRHRVHVQPEDRRQARHQPAPVGRRRSRRSSPAPSRTGTTRRSRPTTPGSRCPTRRIVPVVRSDGSGSTAQFTLWMSKQHGDIWTQGNDASQFPTARATARRQSGSLGRRGLREPGLRRGCDHLRRVLLRARVGLPGREGAERGRLLHRADRATPWPSPCCRRRSTRIRRRPTTSRRSSTASTTTATRAPTRSRATRT